MTPMPNPFINLSAPAENPAAEYSPVRPPGDVAAGPFELPENPAVRPKHQQFQSSSSKGGHQEAPAAAASNPKAAGLHVKFAAMRREKAEPHTFVLDEAWFMAELDEKPLFLRDAR